MLHSRCFINNKGINEIVSSNTTMFIKPTCFGYLYSPSSDCTQICGVVGVATPTTPHIARSRPAHPAHTPYHQNNTTHID
jgi:hypothetical protein